jgi:membrane protein DedA with SNARE-associated domain
MDAGFFEQIEAALSTDIWAVCAGLAIGPFVQEDTAIFTASSLSMLDETRIIPIYAAITFGLSLSNMWKYWGGRAAHSHAWARRMAEKPQVARAARLVHNRLALSLIAARFIPGTRIPLYLAAGYFKADWWRFAFWVAVSSALNVAVFFVLFRAVGAVAGKQAVVWLPIVGALLLVGFLAAKQIRSRRAQGAEPPVG